MIDDIIVIMQDDEHKMKTLPIMCLLPHRGVMGNFNKLGK